MTCFRLAFSVQLVDVPLADGPLKTALVAPEIHGLRLPTSGRERPLDAFSLLVQRDVPGGFDLYTCSCGVAGCAGFHDEVELSVDGQALTWQIPLEPYRDLMPDGSIKRVMEALYVKSLVDPAELHWPDDAQLTARTRGALHALFGPKPAQP